MLGIGFDWSDARLDLEDCDWSAYDLDDVAWSDIRRSVRWYPHAVAADSTSSFAPVCDWQCQRQDYAAWWPIVGDEAMLARVRRTARLSEEEYDLVAAVQVFSTARTVGYPPDLSRSSWTSLPEMRQAATWEASSPTSITTTSLPLRVPVPQLSDEASRRLFRTHVVQNKLWRDSRAERPRSVLAVVGHVVDDALRRGVEQSTLRRSADPRQLSFYGADDPFVVLRAVVEVAGDRRAELSAAIRSELHQGSDALAAAAAPQSGGGLDDIRTLWSIYGTPGTYEERALGWWAWRADALDGTVAIPEEGFWGGPRDPLMLEEVMSS